VAVFLSSRFHIFSFSRDNEPVLRIGDGDTIEMETMDCFSNQIQSEADKLEKLDWSRINPATGPVYIEGAHPGDTLEIHVEKIQVADKGVVAPGKGFGVLVLEFWGTDLRGYIAKSWRSKRERSYSTKRSLCL